MDTCIMHKNKFFYRKFHINLNSLLMKKEDMLNDKYMALTQDGHTIRKKKMSKSRRRYL